MKIGILARSPAFTDGDASFNQQKQIASIVGLETDFTLTAVNRRVIISELDPNFIQRYRTLESSILEAPTPSTVFCIAKMPMLYVNEPSANIRYFCIVEQHQEAQPDTMSLVLSHSPRTKIEDLSQIILSIMYQAALKVNYTPQEACPIQFEYSQNGRNQCLTYAGMWLGKDGILNLSCEAPRGPS